MDIPVHQQFSKTCDKHNQPIILVDSDPEKGIFCFVCIQNMTGLISPNQLFKQQQELIDQACQVNNQDKQQLQNALDAILYYQRNLNQSLEKIIQVIKDQIDTISSRTKQIQNLIQSETISSLTLEKLNTICQNRIKSNIEGRNQVKQYLQRFQYDALNKLQNVWDDQKQKTDLKNSAIKQFQYELLKESSIKNTQWCRAFAFNKEGNILVAACGKVIILYQFMNGQITRELQKLTDHTDQIYCLYFMKQSNLFVSGSKDQSIIIWKINKNNSWSPKSYLKEHKGYVLCILMNKNEDLLISGDYDNTVKFQIKINNQWICKQTIATQYSVFIISLNEYENKLISSSGSSTISIIQLQNDNTWSIIQTIQVCEYGYKLTFVKGNQFVFQPKAKDFIQLYTFDEKLKQFKKLKEIQIQSCSGCESLFPCQYIQQLNIFTIKHGNVLNIFWINDEGDYQLIQTISFGETTLYGRLSDDGAYLAIWDEESKEIQIRQLRYFD